MDFAELTAGIGRLIEKAGCLDNHFLIQPISNRGNNQVTLVTVGSRRLIAKIYFRSESDPRDRFATETQFTRVIRSAGIERLPELFAADPESGIALYEYIEGSKLSAREIDASHVEQAVDFLREINSPRPRQLAALLPNASEAQFSIANHLRLVGTRLNRLSQLTEHDEVDLKAKALFIGLTSQWKIIEERIEQISSNLGWDIHASLPPNDRCISPSDFGFHNAIVGTDGRIKFIDFEYAGWDDPAKTICDFFCQPATPVPRDFLDLFLRGALSYSRNFKELESRVRLLLPLFRMKWCCIVLNPFIPAFLERRMFSDPNLDPASHKKAQLLKATEMAEFILKD